MEYDVIVSRFQFVFMLSFAFNVGWYTANWSRACQTEAEGAACSLFR